MGLELESVSPAGARLVELADKHAAEFAATAERYDRDNTVPYPHWAQMRRSGLLAAVVPTELGGLGVTAVPDVVAAVNRLARGDAAIAIGVAMHLTAFWYFARMLSAPTAAADDPALVARLRLLLRRCARGHAVACVAISEQGTSLGWPNTTAEPSPDGRHRINGRKVFCTNSPVATLFLSTVRVGRPGGESEFGFVLVPRETPGLSVHDNWDALGMRASGSGDVQFVDCVAPNDLVVGVGPVGALPPRLQPLVMVGVLALTGAFLGIAEQAQSIVTAALTAPRRDNRDDPDARSAMWPLVGENEVDLAVGRAMLTRVAVSLDEHLRGDVERIGAQTEELMKEVQCANVAVKRAAIATVDRALTASGGAAYRSASPLSRLYRDVRAGPFMQPFAVPQAIEYISRVRLGVPVEPRRHPVPGN